MKIKTKKCKTRPQEVYTEYTDKTDGWSFCAKVYEDYSGVCIVEKGMDGLEEVTPNLDQCINNFEEKFKMYMDTYLFLVNVRMLQKAKDLKIKKQNP